MRPSSSFAEKLVHNINIENAKKLAFLIVLGLIAYHGAIHYFIGPDSCIWLLWDGRFQGKHIWQPYGCMMHKYTSTDSRNCLRYNAFWSTPNHVMFIGDSRIRQVYKTFVNQLLTSKKSDVDQAKEHSDLIYQDQAMDLTIEFRWSPMVNESMIRQMTEISESNYAKIPNLIVIGSATWSMKQSNGSDDALDSYRGNLTNLVVPMQELAASDKRNVVWMLQDPVIFLKLNESRRMITNEQIDRYNKAAMDVLQSTSVQLWKSSRLISQGLVETSDDGLHIGEVPLQFDNQILWNLYCNDAMNHDDATCCSRREVMTVAQLITFTIFLCRSLIQLYNLFV